MINNISFRFNEINWLVVFLCMIWGRDLLNYANAVFLRLPILNEVGEYAAEIILIISLFMCFRSFSKYITKGCVAFYIAWLLIYLFSYSNYKNVVFLDNNLFPFFLSTLPFVFAGRAVIIDKLSKPFYIVSLIFVILQFLIIVVFKSAEREMGAFENYNMSASYQLLPHLLMVTWYLLRKFNLIDLFICIIGVILLFGYGTRGPLLCWVVFIAAYLIFARDYKKKALSIAIIVVFTLATLVYLNTVFNALSTTTSALGMSNRIVKQIENDALDNNSGRDFIYRELLQATSESGFLGLGICGDRAITAGNDYSHNILIELIVSFGYVFGSLLIIAVLIYCFVSWRCCYTQERKGFFLVLFCFNLHLLLSSSFLQTPLLFFFLGYCGKLINDNKTASNNEYRNEKTNSNIAYVP